MAHIPYGYKIANGRAVIISEEADRIRSLYNSFLQGLSIEAAGKKTGIPLSKSAVGKILMNPVYLGDNYYPQVVEESLYRNVQNEKKASLSYEEGQLANILDFIHSHELNGCFVPETDYCEEEIMLLLEQARVLEQGYVVSFKVGKTIEVYEDT